jgi:hypothetical protein
MLKQFVSSVVAHFVEIEPMNAYIQSIPVDVQYPCYLVNKCDVSVNFLNSYYYMNTVRLYIRVFGKDELALKEKANNVVHSLMSSRGKIHILNEDGTKSSRYIRVENIETIEITVDENEIYCTEINFSFDTTHNVSVGEWAVLKNFYPDVRN